MAESIMKSDAKGIKSVSIDRARWTFEVGKDGVTHFELYEESGHMSMIPWIAVCKGKHIYQRIILDDCRIEHF